MKLGAYASKMLKRIKQDEISSDNPNSLSAKAFRRRILDEGTVEPTLASGGLLSRPLDHAPVAVYEETSNPLLRTLLRVTLVFLLPVLGLILIGVVVFGVIQDSINSSKPTVADTVVLNNVPIPAGSRTINRGKLAQYSIAEATLNRVLPNYNILKHVDMAAYISPKSIKELLVYYDDKLLKSKAWQSYGSMGNGGEITFRLYLTGVSTSIPNSLEALVVSLERVDAGILKQDPLYYDRQATPNETVLIITKSWVAPRQ